LICNPGKQLQHASVVVPYTSSTTRNFPLPWQEGFFAIPKTTFSICALSAGNETRTSAAKARSVDGHGIAMAIGKRSGYRCFNAISLQHCLPIKVVLLSSLFFFLGRLLRSWFSDDRVTMVSAKSLLSFPFWRPN
jgi:hypothetical protein